MGRMSVSNSDVDREWAAALQRTYEMTEQAYNQIPASQSLLPRIRRRRFRAQGSGLRVES